MVHRGEGLAAPSALPKAPVLDWSYFLRHAGAHRRSVVSGLDLVTHKAFTTSGRAALFHALRQLRLAHGRAVLVPTYHCPTMVAPVICAGLNPVFFGLTEEGLPDIAHLETLAALKPAAIIVAHYFGLPKSLGNVRAWCDRHDVALIEDCAHSYYGEAGERPVGHWGDFATASLSKFLPLPEGGLLVSQHRPLQPMRLKPPKLGAQIKGWVDVLELALRFGRLRGLTAVVAPLLWLKNQKPKRVNGHSSAMLSAVESALRDCDMERIDQAPLWVSRLLGAELPRGRVYARRRENFSTYATGLRALRGARPIATSLPDGAAPYVFPLWVDDADRVYHDLRMAGMPVFRWDRLWPGTAEIQGDSGRRWSQHVLQLLCHQDLGTADIETIIARLIELAPARTHD